MSSENQQNDYTSMGNDTNQNNFVDIHFIEIMDEILKFIFKQFYKQVNPDSIRFTSAKISIPVSFDFEYVYQIDIPDGILNSKVFKMKVRSLMLRSDINISGLLVILQGIYNALKEITDLYEDNLQDKKFSQQLIVSASFDERSCDFKFYKNPRSITRFVLFSNKDLNNFCNDISTFLYHILFNKDNMPVVKNGILNAPPSKSEVEKPLIKPPSEPDMQQINSKLLPLTLAIDFNPPCIDSAFKDYLVLAILSMNKTGEIPFCKSIYSIRDNKQFYHAIISLKTKYKLETHQIIELINCSTNIEKKTIRNYLSKYRSVNKK